jgi:hypothetical protein
MGDSEVFGERTCREITAVATVASVLVTGITAS